MRFGVTKSVNALRDRRPVPSGGRGFRRGSFREDSAMPRAMRSIKSSRRTSSYSPSRRRMTFRISPTYHRLTQGGLAHYLTVTSILNTPVHS
jgi:hypothetical protein